MRKIILIFIAITLLSCQTKEENKKEKRISEIKTKSIELLDKIDSSVVRVSLAYGAEQSDDLREIEDSVLKEWKLSFKDSAEAAYRNLQDSYVNLVLKIKKDYPKLDSLYYEKIYNKNSLSFYKKYELEFIGLPKAEKIQSQIERTLKLNNLKVNEAAASSLANFLINLREKSNNKITEMEILNEMIKGPNPNGSIESKAIEAYKVLSTKLN